MRRTKRGDKMNSRGAVERTKNRLLVVRILDLGLRGEMDDNLYTRVQGEAAYVKTAAPAYLLPPGSVHQMKPSWSC